MTTQSSQSKTTKTKSVKQKTPNTEMLKHLKGIGHQLKPIVTIGGKGVTPAIIGEIDRALSDHELIKIKLPAGSKEERQQVADDITQQTESQLIHNIGRMALILRNNPKANPKLSNLVRYAE